MKERIEQPTQNTERVRGGVKRYAKGRRCRPSICLANLVYVITLGVVYYINYSILPQQHYFRRTVVGRCGLFDSARRRD